MLHNLPYGVGRLIGAVVQLRPGAVALEAVEDERGQILDIDAGLDGVLAAGEGELMAADALIESREVAVLAFAEDHAGPHYGELPVRCAGLPRKVNLFGHELRDAVWRVGRGQRLLILFLLRGGVGGDAAGEGHAADAMGGRESGDVFRAADVGLEIVVVGVAWRAVYGGEVDDHVVGLRREAVGQRYALAHVGTDERGESALVRWHDVKVNDLILRSLALDGFGKVRPDESGTAEDEEAAWQGVTCSCRI